MILSPVKRFLIQLTLTFVIFVDNTLVTIQENKVQQILPSTKWCEKEFDNYNIDKEIKTQVIDVCINVLKSNPVKIASNNAKATKKKEIKQKAEETNQKDIEDFICAMKEKNNTESAYKNAKKQLTEDEQTKKKAQADLKKAKVTFQKAKKGQDKAYNDKIHAEKIERKAGSVFRKAEYIKKRAEKIDDRNEEQFNNDENVINSYKDIYKDYKTKYTHYAQEICKSSHCQAIGLIVKGLDKRADEIISGKTREDGSEYGRVLVSDFQDGREYGRALYLRNKEIEKNDASNNKTYINYYNTTDIDYKKAINDAKDAGSVYMNAGSVYMNAEIDYKNAEIDYKNAKFNYESTKLAKKRAKKNYKNAKIIYNKKKKRFTSVCKNEYSEFVNNKTSINK